MKREMTWRRKGLHECRRISIKLDGAAVLLETGRIDLGVVKLSEGNVSSRPLIPQKEECPQEQLGDALREKLCLVYPVVCLREFLIRWDMCLDPGTCQKLTAIGSKEK